MITIGDIVRIHGQQIPNEQAVAMGDERLTYRAFNAFCNRFAHALIGRGIRPGDRVAAIGRNSIAYSALYFAAAKMGAILVPLNFWHRPSELAYVVDDCEPSLLLLDAEFDALLSAADARAPLGRMVMYDEDGSPELHAFLAAGGSEEEPALEVDPASAHQIMYTSGTTGKPKGAVLSHARTVAGSLNMAAHVGIRQTDVYCNYFPTFHGGNWDVTILLFRMGGRVVNIRQFDAVAVLETIQTERVTFAVAVPTMLHSLLEVPSFAETELSSLRLLVFAGYDPSGIVRRVADALGADRGAVSMVQSYGQTEAAPFASVSTPEVLFDRWRTVGRPVPGVEIRLLDPDGRDVRVGDAGEICIRGPMMSGYWNKPEETAAAIRQGWLHTGDIGVFDEDGYLWMVDRLKDLIRSGGHNVYSKEVEDCLATNPAVAEVAIIGVRDPVWEEAVCAVVVAAEPVADDAAFGEALREYVRARLAGYNVPSHVRVVERLPKNGLGKTLKAELRARLAAEFGPAQDRMPKPVSGRS